MYVQVVQEVVVSRPGSDAGGCFLLLFILVAFFITLLFTAAVQIFGGCR